MSRSKKKSLYFCKNIKKNIIELNLSNKFVYNTFFYRKSTLLNNFKFFNFKVYNGRYLKKIKNNKLNTLKKAGEFAFTRKPYFYPLKKKK